jgi:DNA-binding beta-propeller fold protein YncE
MAMRRFVRIVGALGLMGVFSSGLCGCTDECPDQTDVACTFVGTGEAALGDDGLPARQTEIYWAMDLEFAPDGTPYFLDWNNHLVRRVNQDGTVETVIGDFVGDGAPGNTDFVAPGAPGLTVSLNHPTDLVFDDAGHMILMAWHNHKIRVWDPATGLVTVMCGRGATYAGDGTSDLGMVRFNQPKALVRASDGTLYVLDQRNFIVRRIDPDRTVSTFAGIPPEPGMMPVPGYEGDGGPASLARFRFEAGGNPEPSGGLALDEERGVLYVADGINYRIRAIDLETGIIDTIIGTGESGYAGDGGPGRSARISHVRDIEVDANGRLYFTDTENHVVRAWDPMADRVETVVGTGIQGRGVEGQLATKTALDRPMGIAFGPDGALYVADTQNSRFLRIPQ